MAFLSTVLTLCAMMYLREGFAFAASEIQPSEVIDYIFYEQQITPKDKLFIETQLEALDHNPKGAELFQQIRNNLKGRHFLIHSGNEGHNFSPPKDDVSSHELHIDIHFAKLHDSPDATVSGIGNRVSQEVDGVTKYFYEIGTMSYPFYFVLGHELIHALHFLEDEGEYREYLRTFDISLWGLDTDQRRGEFLWNNLEEQRTVIGIPRKNLMDGLSEFTLLLAENRAPRYAYQRADGNFYETDSAISRVFLMQSMPNLTRENWRFNKADAQISPYTSRGMGIKLKIAIVILVVDEISEEELAEMKRKRELLFKKMI